MKIRSVVIGVLVGGALVGGVGYAAYYTMRGQAVPVEVAPVANMASDSSWFSYENSIWGSVTSQASQSVSLDSEYPIDEVYVTSGEEVTEGTPLFSYDMTLEEIELEGDEIELLSLQLQLSRYQKELEKYQNMTPTAKSADRSDEEFDEAALWRLPEFTLTVLAAEEGVSIESVEPVDAADAADIPEAADAPEASNAPTAPQDGGSSVSVESVEPVGSAQSGSNASGSSSSQTGSQDGDLVVEEIEEVSGADTEDEVYRTAVRQYEDLMTTLELYADEDGSLDYTKTVRKALKKAVNFYQEKLTDRTEEETTDENGETVTEVRYELKQNVTRVLDEGELEELNAHVEQMDAWQAAYEAQKTESAAETGEESASAAGTQAAAEPAGANETIAAPAEENEDAAVTIEEIEPVEAEEEKKSAETAEAAADGTEEDGESEVTTNADNAEDGTPSETQSEETGTTDSGTTTESDSESEETQTDDKGTEETEPEETETAKETDAPAAQTVADWISSFLLMAEDIELSPEPEQAGYRNALEFYQQYLAASPTIIIEDETEEGHRSTFQNLMVYQELSDEVVEYLNPSVLDGETSPADPDVTEEELKEIYERLCIDFCIILLDEEDEYFLDDLNELFQAYTALTEEQKKSVRHDSLLLGYALKYGLIDTLEQELESELESELEEWEDDDWDDEDDTEDWDDWYDDWYDDDWYDDDWDDEEYTAEELQELITDLEESIKELELDIRECELTVEQAQRVVDGKVVTSALNGTVISIGDEEGNSDDDYFVRVASTAGLYAKGVISELELDTVNVGDEISGLSDDGEPFTAVIKEVSDYPDSSGSDSVSGGNTNASYYTFYALIDNPEGIEEGYADLTLSDAFTNEDDSIWLETYFVRTDSAGNNYVYVEGSDGKLEQRFVTTGKTYEDWAVEITGGLGRSDMIAFPYGDNVYEGAPTKEVSSLEALYDD